MSIRNAAQERYDASVMRFCVHTGYASAPEICASFISRPSTRLTSRRESRRGCLCASFQKLERVHRAPAVRLHDHARWRVVPLQRQRRLHHAEGQLQPALLLGVHEDAQRRRRARDNRRQLSRQVVDALAARELVEARGQRGHLHAHLRRRHAGGGDGVRGVHVRRQVPRGVLFRPRAFAEHVERVRHDASRLRPRRAFVRLAASQRVADGVPHGELCRKQTDGALDREPQRRVHREARLRVVHVRVVRVRERRPRKLGRRRPWG